jgi:hypothetical protein
METGISESFIESCVTQGMVEIVPDRDPLANDSVIVPGNAIDGVVRPFAAFPSWSEACKTLSGRNAEPFRILIGFDAAPSTVDGYA